MENKSFAFWKRPWHRWLILAAAAVQLLACGVGVATYLDIADAGPRIMSAEEWAEYSAGMALSCSAQALCAASFFSMFLIGALAKRSSAANKAAGILLLIVALCWGLGGLAFGLATSKTRLFFWLLVLAVALIGGLYSLRKSRKERAEGK